MKSGIAYIDDRPINLKIMQALLESEFSLKPYEDPGAFLKDYHTHTFDTILVDVHMPTIDGFTLYTKILEHTHYNGCPIIFITGDLSDESRIRSLQLGAVEYITRETAPEEVMARIRSKIEFFKQIRSAIEFGPLKINLNELKAYFNQEELSLTFIELKILSLLLKYYPEVSKESLVEQIWKNGYVLDATIYTHISNLNAKLKQWDHEILSTKGKGITLVKKQSL